MASPWQRVIGQSCLDLPSCQTNLYNVSGNKLKHRAIMTYNTKPPTSFNLCIDVCVSLKHIYTSSPALVQAAPDDTELLRLALIKIQLLEDEKAEALGRHQPGPSSKAGTSKPTTPGGPSPDEKSGDEPDETNDKKDDPPIVHPDGQPVA